MFPSLELTTLFEKMRNTLVLSYCSTVYSFSFFKQCDSVKQTKTVSSKISKSEVGPKKNSPSLAHLVLKWGLNEKIKVKVLTHHGAFDNLFFSEHSTNYFATTIYHCWISCVAALAYVGGFNTKITILHILYPY